MPIVCVDTNLWFYALARPADGEQAKHLAARGLVAGLEHPVITPQIVNELSANLLRKRAWNEPELRLLIADLHGYCRFFIPSPDWHELASRLRQSHTLSFWDSLIVASALSADCEILFSEDMHHGLRIGSLDILNPYTAPSRKVD